LWRNYDVGDWVVLDDVEGQKTTTPWAFGASRIADDCAGRANDDARLASIPCPSFFIRRDGSPTTVLRGDTTVTQPPSSVARTIKVPGPDHPITVEHNVQRVVVRVSGHVVADTRNALTLKEASYPAVQYIPRQDVDMTLLKRTDHATYCPYKGECAYYSIPIGAEHATNAVWTYEHPFDAVALIKDYVAFYPDRVDAIKELDR
jgi:uncharacterized protein (DUF427 family)